MSWYAATGRRFSWQVASDLFVLLWFGLCWWAAQAVHDAVVAVAGPVRSTQSAAQDLSDRVAEIGETAGGVPLVGDQLSGPFDSASEQLDEVVAAAQGQIATIERAADVLFWAVLLVPVLLVVALWLPRRVRFVVDSRAARRYIDAAPDLDLFALRAMATQPMPRLAAISGDPVAAWRRGDRDVITQLAEIELRREGLRVPERLRLPGGGAGSASG